jgi:hypothetical protein
VGKDNKKIVLSVFLLIFAACGRNERAGKNGKNEKAERIVKAGTAEKNEETGRIERAGKNGRSLLFQHNLR